MPDLDAIDDLARLPAAAPGGSTTTLALGYLDIVVVLLATAPALISGVPAFGYAMGAGAWLVQRAFAHFDRNWIRRAREPRAQLGLNLVEAFGRIWLLAGAIVLAGVVGGRADGLTAGLTICGAYTLAFAIRVTSGPPRRGPARREVVR